MAGPGIGLSSEGMAPKRFETLRRSVAMSDLDMNSEGKAENGLE